MQWQQACEAIASARGIVLCAHRHPDGDGIGSQIALFHALKNSGREVFAHNLDGVPSMYRFIPGTEHVSQGQDFRPGQEVDLIICLDSGNIERIGLPPEFFKNRTILNIDHHLHNTRFGQHNLIVPEACATGEIVHELIKRLHLSLSAAIATAIFTAVLTDTCSFRLSTANANVHRLAAELIDAGADPWKISTGVYESYSQSRLDLLALCLKTLEIRDGGRSAWLFSDLEMRSRTGAGYDDTEGFIEYARSLSGVEVAVFITPEDEHRWKVSFRNKTIVDVSDIASFLGGGGHSYAAACLIRGSRDEVLMRVQSAVTDALK